MPLMKQETKRGLYAVSSWGELLAVPNWWPRPRPPSSWLRRVPVPPASSALVLGRQAHTPVGRPSEDHPQGAQALLSYPAPRRPHVPSLVPNVQKLQTHFSVG